MNLSEFITASGIFTLLMYVTLLFHIYICLFVTNHITFNKKWIPVFSEFSSIIIGNFIFLPWYEINFENIITYYCVNITFSLITYFVSCIVDKYVIPKPIKEDPEMSYEQKRIAIFEDLEETKQCFKCKKNLDVSDVYHHSIEKGIDYETFKTHWKSNNVQYLCCTCLFKELLDRKLQLLCLKCGSDLKINRNNNSIKFECEFCGKQYSLSHIDLQEVK